MKHRQVEVHCPIHGSSHLVDEKLCVLLPAMWSHGIETKLSCQDNTPSGFAWIMLKRAGDFERFREIVSFKAPKQFKRSLGQRYADENANWRYQFFPIGSNLSIRFPSGQIGFLEKQFERAANRGFSF